MFYCQVVGKVSMDMYCVVICLPIRVCVSMCVCEGPVSFGSGPNGVARTVSSRRCGDDSQGCPPSSFPAIAKSCQFQPQSAHFNTNTHCKEAHAQTHTYTGFCSPASVHTVLELATQTNLEHMLLLKLNQTCLHSQAVS